MKGYKRKDVTVEKCVKLYAKYQNAQEVARILQTTATTVISRLHEADIDTTQKDYTKRRKNPKRIVFDTKEEQAHYICTMLREPLTDLIIECMRRNEE